MAHLKAVRRSMGLNLDLMKALNSGRLKAQMTNLANQRAVNLDFHLARTKVRLKLKGRLKAVLRLKDCYLVPLI
jgi:hypothetical protein